MKFRLLDMCDILRPRSIVKKYQFMPASNKKLPDARARGAQTSVVAAFLESVQLVKVLETCSRIIQRSGVHSVITMAAAGFYYMNETCDTARCDNCGLEVSEWTLDMQPFVIHAQRSPKCGFVQNIQPESSWAKPESTTVSTKTINNQPFKKELMELKNKEIGQVCILTEVKALQEVRKHTFSHWPLQASPSRSQMIEAGMFACNVGDRVICMYCNIICQQWRPHGDDPFEVHRKLSPKCPYVVASEQRTQTATIRIVNGQSSNLGSGIDDISRCDEIVYTAACHSAYIEIPRRHASFATWPNKNLPPVDDLVRAGFFYTGAKTVVTCFYCNGSLQNWGANDNPTIEHARWFPHCAYAKQLCGAELYRRVQESKRAQQERTRINDASNSQGNSSSSFSRGHLIIPDESTLSRYVAARMDLAISQDLLNRQFKMSVIKRCYEDQLRLKHDDFYDSCDVLMACLILQKQIDCIGGKKENIIIPSVAISKIRQREQEEAAERESAINPTSAIHSSNTIDADMTTASASSSSEQNTQGSTMDTQNETEGRGTKAQSTSKSTPSTNPCALCLEEERCLACIPCGHLATCVPCGHSLRSCPICRTNIDAFVRIYQA